MTNVVKIEEICSDIVTEFSDKTNRKDFRSSCLNEKPALRLLDIISTKLALNRYIKLTSENGRLDVSLYKHIESLNLDELIANKFNQLINLDEMAKITERDLSTLSVESQILDMDEYLNVYVKENKATIVLTFTIKIGDVDAVECNIFVDINLDIPTLKVA